MLLTLSPAVPAIDDPFATQRTLYLEALRSLDAGRTKNFQSVTHALKDYPLYPYLLFGELRKRIDKASYREVASFIKSYSTTPLAERMRKIWLHSLAGKSAWRQFLKIYQSPQSVTLQCHALTARMKSGRTKNLHEDILTLWLTGKSQPEACDPAFQWLYNSGKLTHELLWQRVRLALKKNHSSLAGFLAKRLPDDDAAWIKIWRDARFEPQRIINKLVTHEDSSIAREIIQHALQHMSRFSSGKAFDTWQTVRGQFAFDESAIDAIDRDIALRAAWQRLPEAHERLSHLAATAVDERTREWRIRSAIHTENWPGILKATDELTADEKQQDEWKYWQAAAKKMAGLHLESSNEFSMLAKERSFYGFLAADQMAWPYEMGDKPLQANAALIKEIGERPAIIRARELLLARHMTNARREWLFATRDMSDTELEMAAELADRWGWHDRAILTIAKTGNYGDLELRFPLAHEQEVHQQAGRYKLDSSIVFAVIRQESAFNYQAVSPAGARGLMQLMPKTGRRTARKNNIKLGSLWQLFEPAKNIHIGTSYLKQVSDRYDGHAALTAASYNAGPHRVNHWLSDEREHAAAHWIAVIPFKETRHYVQRILTYAAIYDWRLKQPITKLSARMPVVKKKSGYPQVRN